MTEDGHKAMRRASSDIKSERATASAPVVTSPEAFRPCPVCGQAMRGRKTSACSDRCRAATSRWTRIPLPVVEARAIRESRGAILEPVSRINEPLGRYEAVEGDPTPW
jgi:hypothetical protein